MQKVLWMLRHGQAAHNVRAESARKAGCDFDTFLHLMHLDDAYDAPLTQAGILEAKDAATRADAHSAQPQLVLVSPLSRALYTATIVFPRHTQARAAFVCDERLRERNGKLLNAKRRPKSELERAFPSCDFSALADESDTQWTPELESLEACAARGREVLDHVWERAESEIAIVGHGGLFYELLNGDGIISVGSAADRFSNCELRRLLLRRSADGGYIVERQPLE